MRVFSICQKWRYAISLTRYSFFPLNFNSIPSNSYILASGSTFTSHFATSIFISDKKYCCQFSRYNFSFRLFSTSYINSFAKTRLNFVVSQVSKGEVNTIVDIIKDDGSDMESRLNSIGSDLSKFVLEILHCLNLLKVPALRFFTWFKNAHLSYSRNQDICSLVVANCGLLGDYVGMLNLLIDFRSQQICLNEKAFSFLPISSSSTSMEITKKRVTELIRLLTHVGGSCCNSGIHSLVEMLCCLSCFDLAKYVVEITEKKASHYSMLVKHLCIRGQFEDARNLLKEMRQLKSDPDAKAYNYLISSFCKQGSIDEAFTVFEEMLSIACSPNLITFQILIDFACRYGRSDQAIILYNQMVSCEWGVKPRLSTHYAFIRGYFHSQQYDEAYKYVTAAAVDKCLALDVYSALATLHIREGNLLVAYNVFVDMLDKGLKPKHSIFLRALRGLRKIGKDNFAENLKTRYYTQVVG